MGRHMVGASQRLAGRQESCRDSWVCALTSKWQVGVLLWEHRGWILRMASLYKGQTVCRMQAIRHENQKGFLQTGSLCFLSDFRRQTINISRLSCT